MPLPPYIRRQPVEEDKVTYQTVYARCRGAVAAPTAGLHFTTDLLEKLRNRGTHIASVVLHVGPGTFRPVTAEDPAQHKMEPEYYEVSEEAAGIVNRARAEEGRIVAVGTTSVRTLETVAINDPEYNGRVMSASGWTNLFIYPPYPWKVVDALVTNFHLPRSTLLMLVAAFAGRQLVLDAYRTAIREGYRFYSYGDAMLIL
jgi:S-adenosylmethionine:tRNA ribosyltransferase-isomerase